ncbi:hypothetical protein CLOP_g8647, partial [Closterium sp. NIES-67]
LVTKSQPEGLTLQSLLARSASLPRSISPEVVAIASVYFVQGVLGLARLAVTFLLKDDFQLDPAEVAVLSGLSSLPWLIKPVYGFISDGIPLFGYRRRSYLIACGLLGSLAWASLASVVGDKYSAVAMILLSSLSAAVSDVVVDSMVVQRARGESQATSGGLQSLCWGSSAVGAVLSAYFSGSLIENYGTRFVFGVTALLPLITTAVGFYIPEDRVTANKSTVTNDSDSTGGKGAAAAAEGAGGRVVRGGGAAAEGVLIRGEAGEVTAGGAGALAVGGPSGSWAWAWGQLVFLWETVRQPAILLPTTFIFLWQATPHSETAMFYFTTNELGFGPEFLGRVRLVTALASLAGVGLFNFYLKEVPLRKLFLWTNVVGAILGSTQKKQLSEMLTEFLPIFATKSDQIGLYPHLQLHIETGTKNPIAHKPYRAAPAEKELIEKEVKTLLDQGVIRPSHSPWAAPCLVIPKKDFGIRVVIDYRRLNAITKSADRFPLPRIDEILDQLRGAQYFTILDIKSAYYNIAVAEQDIPKTAFVTPTGLYEFTRMPFGLKNAPATWQRFIMGVFRDLPFIICYLDDAAIWSTTWEEHLGHIKLAMRRVKEHSLLLKINKCNFGFNKMPYLGHIISRDGVAPDPEKIKAVKEWPTPENVKQIRGFLGLASYYRRFIRGFAKIATPMNQLLKNETPFEWTDDCEEAFQKLKTALTSSPILVYPDFTKPFLLQTDFSAQALLLVTGLNRTLGISDQYFLLGDSLILTVLGQISFMPVLVLAARVCPPASRQLYSQRSCLLATEPVSLVGHGRWSHQLAWRHEHQFRQSAHARCHL